MISKKYMKLLNQLYREHPLVCNFKVTLISRSWVETHVSTNWKSKRPPNTPKTQFFVPINEKRRKRRLAISRDVRGDNHERCTFRTCWSPSASTATAWIIPQEQKSARSFLPSSSSCCSSPPPSLVFFSLLGVEISLGRCNDSRLILAAMILSWRNGKIAFFTTDSLDTDPGKSFSRFWSVLLRPWDWRSLILLLLFIDAPSLTNWYRNAGLYSRTIKTSSSTLSSFLRRSCYFIIDFMREGILFKLPAFVYFPTLADLSLCSTDILQLR